MSPLHLPSDSEPLPPSRPFASGGTAPVLVIATASARTPALRDVDWIRLDGAEGTLRTLARHRSRQDVPVLFDVPGPLTRRTGSLLTTSEYLVFAAAEDFEWVNLRGHGHPSDIERAREFLPASTRLTVTVQSPTILRHELGPIFETADAVLFSRAAMARALGPRRADEALLAAVRAAANAAIPSLLVSGLLPSMLRSDRPSDADLSRLTSYVRAGVRGLVLTRETTVGVDPQSCVDVTRLVAEGPRPRSGLGAAGRPAARVGGRMSIATTGVPHAGSDTHA